MRWFTGPRLLRAAAVLIAVLAAIDPAISTERFARSEVSVVLGDSARDARIGAEVTRTLSRAFTVVQAPWAKASATVIVGDALPQHPEMLGGALFAVVPDDGGPAVALEAVDAPATASLNGRVPVRVLVRTNAARGRSLDIGLRSGGLLVDHLVVPIASDSSTVPLSLSFVPTSIGIAPLHITAAIVGAPLEQAVSADAMIDVRDTRWAVLFYDARPSWMSTFVRRAVERDGRFVVTSRVVTSRNVSTDAGSPPAGLAESAALGLFDVVVVGAPEALTDRDVTGLDAFLRRRGGQVILLLDDRTAGPYRRLLDVASWRSDSGSTVYTVASSDSSRGTMRASELLSPSRLPAGAELLSRTTSAADRSERAVVWRTAVGAGQLIVSGALDGWRYRAEALSGFDRFWRGTVASAAAATATPIEVRLSPNIIAPDDSTFVTVTLRESMLQEGTQTGQASVSATLESTGTVPRMVRLWPVEAAGAFRGVIRGAAPGSYRVVVRSGGQQGEGALQVGVSVSHAAAPSADLLTAWVAARGGAVVRASHLAELTAQIRGAIGSEPHRERWHPMRSPWWLVPFASFLALEWWFRRRRGLA